MRKIKPDILISDISMNNMDGLAMVAAIKSEYPDIEVCLLTGFRNFEYAQQAIKLGVTRFLLKPSKIDELEEAISAMTNNLKQKGNDSSNAEIDSIWSRSDEEENYIYETFIKNHPECDTPEKDRLKCTDANNFILKNALKFIYEHYKLKLSLLDRCV